MNDQQRIFPGLPARLVGLEDLAENLWWCWHPRARMLFKMLDRQAWKQSGHNPDRMLRDLSGEVLSAAAADAEYLHRYDEVMSDFNTHVSGQHCRYLDYAQRNHSFAVAYFSAEYGLHRSLPFYAGGLGFLAGDYLKECSDLCIPLVAVGFMYPEGYLRQRLGEDGWQEDRDEPLDRDAAAISRVMGGDGKQLVVRVPFMDPGVHVAVWKVKVGQIPLYLLDTDIPDNDPASRGICARLYIGDAERRLRQELVLGLGGAEVLRALGTTHYLLHLNEGHAAFALLERIRERVEAGMPFDEAREQVRNTSIFTTHTPVPAGHDVFPNDLMESHFHAYWPSLGLDRDTFLRLGAHPDQPDAGFNMSALALRLSAFANGVSRRHGEVSRQMWRSLWPDRPVANVPITHVTNGVHVPTWIEPKIQLLLDEYLGADWLDRHDAPELWDALDRIPDEELWRTHYWLKIKLIDAIRERARQRLLHDGAGPSLVMAGGALLDPSVLTIGFARRFATYKRATLIFRDSERLQRLLNDRRRPVQFIFAGKAHPADDPGKRLLQELVDMARAPAFGGRIAFVEDYGEQLAQYMVHGVDVWLNNPLPPLEASGTSGMKAAMNGVPQLSILDGWWEEGYDGENGWAIRHEEKDGDGDRLDAEEIYRTLESDIVPRYYRVDAAGVPIEWVKTMKAAMRGAGARFSARRMVREYTEKFYTMALKEVASLE
ncbi:alpha-glucan family phosphorylase [bacterium]|nr:alpha-glucan family phosphorylase [bacterium]MBU1073541.1 alpha-glucan family phosphorylase [bacterium]MBU1674641.1 alpha-glucan family phosphorylase [bacterium]